MTSTQSTPSSNGRVAAASTVARVTLRPIGSPLPLGASLLKDNARRSILPIGRRGLARTALNEGLDAQLAELEHEAGVREQL